MKRRRSWLDPEWMEVEIRTVVPGGWVEYRYVSQLLHTLGMTLGHLEALGERHPEEAFRLYRVFVGELFEAVERVHYDENDLPDFIEDVVESALELLEESEVPLDRVSLLTDLVRLWSEDRNDVLRNFLPQILRRLDLDEDESRRLFAATGIEVAGRSLEELVQALDCRIVDGGGAVVDPPSSHG